MRKKYRVRFAEKRPGMDGDWGSAAWKRADTLELASFRPESSSHRPRTRARLLYDLSGISGIFLVEDRYVRSVRTKHGEHVYKDSCVEFFLKPAPAIGYFNFEFNCGGAMLCSYVRDPLRTESGLRDLVRFSDEDYRRVLIYRSLPSVIDPEISEHMTWALEFFIPFALLAKFAGPLAEDLNNPAGGQWHANFYKCADETSHPHWASWNPIDERNFHLPQCFGVLNFERPEPRETGQ